MSNYPNAMNIEAKATTEHIQRDTQLRSFWLRWLWLFFSILTSKINAQNSIDTAEIKMKGGRYLWPDRVSVFQTNSSYITLLSTSINPQGLVRLGWGRVVVVVGVEIG